MPLGVGRRGVLEPRPSAAASAPWPGRPGPGASTPRPRLDPDADGPLDAAPAARAHLRDAASSLSDRRANPRSSSSTTEYRPSCAGKGNGPSRSRLDDRTCRGGRAVRPLSIMTPWLGTPARPRPRRAACRGPPRAVPVTPSPFFKRTS